MGPKRDWEAAREKCELEGSCRVCGYQGGIEAAHVVGRVHDRPFGDGSTRWVNPDSVIPLCNHYGSNCHGKYDAHELDILSYLTLSEQLKAVEDAGSIESARRRLCPSEFAESQRSAVA